MSYKVCSEYCTLSLLFFSLCSNWLYLWINGLPNKKCRAATQNPTVQDFLTYTHSAGQPEHKLQGTHCKPGVRLVSLDAGWTEKPSHKTFAKPHLTEVMAQEVTREEKCGGGVKRGKLKLERRQSVWRFSKPVWPCLYVHTTLFSFFSSGCWIVPTSAPPPHTYVNRGPHLFVSFQPHFKVPEGAVKLEPAEVYKCKILQ